MRKFPWQIYIFNLHSGIFELQMPKNRHVCTLTGYTWPHDTLSIYHVSCLSLYYNYVAVVCPVCSVWGAPTGGYSELQDSALMLDNENIDDD